MTVERSAPPTNLVELLELEQLRGGLFLGRSAARGRERVYGGQVVAQALTAARSTVPDDHKVHSLHGYFIRAGDETVPIVFDVDLIRDGRSFTTRRVVARQPGGAIFNLSCSFHRDEPDVEFSRAVADLAVPPPDECIHEEWDDISDVRTVPGTEPGRAIAWIRNALPDRLPDDPWVHTAAMVYASDHIPMDAVWAATPRRRGTARARTWGRVSTIRSGSTGNPGPTNGSSTTCGCSHSRGHGAWPMAPCTAPTGYSSPRSPKRDFSAGFAKSDPTQQTRHRPSHLTTGSADVHRSLRPRPSTQRAPRCPGGRVRRRGRRDPRQRSPSTAPRSTSSARWPTTPSC
ncbi:MAG: thioesterase family protein [Acidimicrobiales bacterium]